MPPCFPVHDAANPPPGIREMVQKRQAYRIYPDRAELLFQKYVESDKELPSKYEVEYYPNKKKKEYIIEKTISMEEAPESYLLNLQLYEPIIKSKKKNERSSNLRKRRIR